MQHSEFMNTPHWLRFEEIKNKTNKQNKQTNHKKKQKWWWDEDFGEDGSKHQ